MTCHVCDAGSGPVSSYGVNFHRNDSYRHPYCEQNSLLISWYADRECSFCYLKYKKGKVMAEIDWRKYIHSDPDVLIGKPVVKGTRLSVEFILSLFAEGWTESQVLENYPKLTKEILLAVFAFTTDCMREESLYSLPAENV
jgi:uncharacterized protein (DUF433 family)